MYVYTYVYIVPIVMCMKYIYDLCDYVQLIIAIAILTLQSVAVLHIQGDTAGPIHTSTMSNKAMICESSGSSLTVDDTTQ